MTPESKPMNLLSILERIKDVTGRSKGQIKVTTYLPGARDYFRIEYDPQQKTGIYTKYTSCQGDQRETVEEFWPSRMYDVFNTVGAVARAEIQGRESRWFDSAQDPGYAVQMLRFITGNPCETVLAPVASVTEQKRDFLATHPLGAEICTTILRKNVFTPKTIAVKLKKTLPTVLQSLQALERIGLLSSKKLGRDRHYKFVDDTAFLAQLLGGRPPGRIPAKAAQIEVGGRVRQ